MDKEELLAQVEKRVKEQHGTWHNYAISLGVHPRNVKRIVKGNISRLYDIAQSTGLKLSLVE